MREVFMEVKRILKPTGTLWLNIGDSYASSGKNRTEAMVSNNSTLQGGMKSQIATLKQRNKITDGLKPKDMIGVPWRLAFAMQNFAVVPFYAFQDWAEILYEARVKKDWEAVEFVENVLRGYGVLNDSASMFLRQDIIWQKVNPQPESVKDRCTKAHEYIFLLSKSNKYYFDHIAIQTPYVDFEKESKGTAIAGFRADVPGKTRQSANQKTRDTFYSNAGANKRSVWAVSSQSYEGAHFATYPEKLMLDSIKAGSSEHGCCANCGRPYRRVTEKKLVPGPKASFNSTFDARDAKADANCQSANRMRDGHKPGHVNETTTLGWEPTCTCKAGIVPSLVLDPFAGTGTTLVTAQKLGRDFIGIELGTDNIPLIESRFAGELGMFNTKLKIESVKNFSLTIVKEIANGME